MTEQPETPPIVLTDAPPTRTGPLTRCPRCGAGKDALVAVGFGAHPPLVCTACGWEQK